MNCKNQYAKSCVRVSNAVPQVVTDTATPLVLRGVTAVDSGCAITLDTSSVTINKSGLYRFSADLVFTPSAAGTFTVQLYNNGIPVASALSRDGAESGNTAPMHIDTELCLSACCASKPVITLVVSGVAGSVTNVSFGAVKLA